MPNITTNHAITYTNAPLYAVRIVLQTPISNKPWCLLYVPYENYSKILGISKKEQKHLIHSVSCLINATRLCVFHHLAWCQVQSKERLTMATQ